jgi:hypothetical protein
MATLGGACQFHSPAPGSADHSRNDREDGLGRSCPQTGHPARREEQAEKPDFEKVQLSERSRLVT